MAEIELWKSRNYRIMFDRNASEMVYRVYIPMEKLKQMI